MGLFRRGSTEPGDRWVIVGLGNPGEGYASTRHNAGVMVVERLLERTGSRFKRHKSGTFVAEAMVAGVRVVLARTVSAYMNESGRPVRQLVDWYKAPPRHVVVVHDELDVPFGDVRIKLGGGTAGHNGLKSIASHLGTKDFIRVRIGISRPAGLDDATDHVLDRFSSSERRRLEEILDRAADAVERILEAGIDRAMTEYNARDPA